jgi:DNA-binding beta-propeller fold protein YncE
MNFRKSLLVRCCLTSLLVVAAGVGGLAGGGKPSPAPPENTTALVWPQPPQQKRVVYLRQIRGVDDVLGIAKRSWVDRAAGAKKAAPRQSLSSPYGVVTDSQGRIYVADSANHTVFVFDVEQKRVEFRGDHAPAKLAMPIGLAIDRGDRLFVSDSFLHQVTCFNSDGQVRAVFGMHDLERPGGIALDSARNRLYVADAKANRVAVFDTQSFRKLGLIGAPSTPGKSEDGKFSAPTNVAVDAQGRLYVTDTWNHRVQVFSPDGKFVRAFGSEGSSPGSFVRPKGIALDSEGHIYVADAEFNNFQVFNPDGQPLLAVGDCGADPGQFALIAGMWIDKNNRIYVTDQWRGRVQVFQYYPERPAPAAPRAAP